MSSKYNQIVRTITASVFLVILILIFKHITGNFIKFIVNNNLDERICFLSGALMLILGSYFAEPHFTKPTDAIANSIAVIIALVGLSKPDSFFGYIFLIIYSSITFFSSILSIIIKNRFKRTSRALYKLVELLGKSKVIFSFLFLFSIYTYYGTSENLISLIILSIYWFALCCTSIVEKIIDRIICICNTRKEDKDIYIGTATGCDNPFLYTAIVNSNIKELKFGNLVILNKDNGDIFIGIIICIKQLLEKYHIKIYLLFEGSNFIKCDKKSFRDFDMYSNSVFKIPFSINYLSIDNCSEALKNKIKNSHIYKNINMFAGYITANSNIHKINFELVNDVMNIAEGDIFVTRIQNKKTLYQVINGRTEIESVDAFNNYGFTTISCIKLGEYLEESKELKTVDWLPKTYEPIFKLDNCSTVDLRIIAENSIGRLPNTNYMIPIKDINSLVTHNTAILGILGIGKSCLAFELLKKTADSNIKLIIIDITNQYSNLEKGLPKYISSDYIENDMTDENLGILQMSRNNSGADNQPAQWGNEKKYQEIIFNTVNKFMNTQNKRVLLLNPNNHPVTKALSQFRIAERVELTPAEKTRIISECIYEKMISMGESDDAKVWLVFEEAHSLVPEWNSSANPGDSSATNGTARVILQGRKYGLGCLLITQRTANISKSLLNQCNTIFALRVFDDTGKTFLENYIGSDYSNALPSLEERHAIVMGKGLKLKQPLIIRLNEKEHCINQE